MKAEEYYDTVKFKDNWGVDIIYPSEVTNIIEIARLEGILTGLELVEKPENISENKIFYKEELAKYFDGSAIE